MRSGLAHWLHSSGAVHALLKARYRVRSRWVTVLTYHRIHERPITQPFDPGVIDATPEQFEAQLRTLKEYFTLVGVEDVLGFLAGKTLPPNPAVVTFDDGYKESYTVALPILRRLGIKAAFFVSTDYISNRRVFWWDRLSYLLGQSQLPTIRLTYPRPITLDLRPHGLNRARQTLLAATKGHYDLDLEHFLNDLARAAEVPWDEDVERHHAKSLVMTWDDVRALRHAGMEVHSHTRTHRILQNLRPEELWQELVGSRQDIEEQLGEPVQALSYPVGRSIACDDRIRSAVRRAGYRVGFSNATGMSRFTGESPDPLDVRRISLEIDIPISYFGALLAFPMLARP